jgi:hypothetical protein
MHLGKLEWDDRRPRRPLAQFRSYRVAHLLRNIGATALLTRHTIAYVSHRQHFGSGLFGG